MTDVNRVWNYLSNSAERTRRFAGDKVSNIKTAAKDLATDVRTAAKDPGRFVEDAWESYAKNTQYTPYGTPVSAYGTDYETATRGSRAAQRAGRLCSESVTDQARKGFW